MGGDRPAPDSAWLLAALEHSSDLVAVIRPDGTVDWASAAIRRLLGYEQHEVIGKSMVEYLHPEDLETAAEIMALAAASQFDKDTPLTPALYRLRHADGSWLTLELNGATPIEGTDDLLMIIRRSSDQVLNDQLLELLISGAPVDEQLALVLELGRWRYPTEGYVIQCRDDEGRRAAHAVGVHDDRLTGLTPVDGPTPWDAAMATGDRVVVDDVTEHPAVAPELAAAAVAAGFDAAMAVPVDDPLHDTGACIVVWSTPEGPSVSGHRYPTTAMERSLTLALQWRAHLRTLERAARVDGLTGVATRQRFFELAPGWLDLGASAVCYVDLDGFKAVNDRHGHSAGDYVLATTAWRMAEAAGPDVLLGRLGGDEFALLCPPAAGLDAAQALAGGICTSVRQPIELDAGPVTIGASIGIATRRADESIDALLERADAGLLAAKAAGKGAWHVVDA